MKRKKITFIINNFLIGGVERLIFDLISSFDKDKYEIQIITVLGTGPLENKFQKLHIPIHFAFSKRPYQKYFLLRVFWVIFSPITILRVVFFLLKSKPDIVFSSLYQGDVIGMFASKIIGVKNRVVIQHDIQKLGVFRRFFKDKFALRFSTGIIAVSETVKDFLISYFKVQTDKIKVILNGVDYARFKEGWKDISSDLVIGIIGRLEEVKGHIYALKAFKILKEKYNLSPLVLLAGDGSLRTNLEEYVIKNNLNSIKFLGAVADPLPFLQKIDILIIPSIEEGLGLVVLEGLASEKIVLVSDINVFQELLENQRDYFFSLNNPDSLASLLKHLEENPSLIQKYKKNLESWFKKKAPSFNIKQTSKLYEELF